MITQRIVAKALISAALSATLIGAPFRCCRAEEGREHGPPPAAAPAIAFLYPPSPAPLAARSTFTLPLPSVATASSLAHATRGEALRHALVKRTIAHTFWGARVRFLFSTPANGREEQQRRKIAIYLGRAISRRGDGGTASRITEIYESLRLAQWGRHANGLLGGHFNFDYSAVRCADFDRMMPHGRYGNFASLHFHHNQERVHLDAANPFGLAGLLAPVHIFVDVVGGHLPWRNRHQEDPGVALVAQPSRAHS